MHSNGLGLESNATHTMSYVAVEGSKRPGSTARSVRLRKPRIHKLQTRIVLAFSLLLLLIQATSLVMINTVLSERADQDIRRNLLAGQRVFNQVREDNNRQLIQSATIMSSDFAFRKAIATGDYGTVVSTLTNHGARIKADVLLLVATDGKMIADTLPAGHAEPTFQFQELIGTAEQRGQSAAMVALDDKLYQMVVVPVLGPLPIAWLIVGFNIDEKFVRNLQAATALNVSFLAGAPNKNEWRLLASTLPAGTSAAFPKVLHGLPVGEIKEDNLATLSMGDEDHLALSSDMGKQGGTQIIAILQQSLQQALEPLRRLQVILLYLSAISLLAMLAASYKIARNITKPISVLGNLARRIQQGDYSEPATVDREDEIGELASAFNHMKDGLATREAKITELAYRDQLTGLPNRILFHDRLEQSAKLTSRAGQNLALLIINLDRFKEVNVILGHHIGDLLLQEISRRLAFILERESDTLARLGGDEFAVLLSDCDARGAMMVARKILDTLDQPILLEGQEVIATGSIGIAIYPEHGSEINTLMRRADIAKYEAKRNNAGYALFDLNYVEKNQEHLSLLAGLRHAIERNEFVLYYQPKVRFAAGEIGHVEALVRWIHPERGMIPPDQFIPYAEHTGYIRNITRWVIEEAFRQRKEWEQMQLPLTVSVNISARDLVNADLPRVIAELMDKYGASPDWMCLEITESAIMGDTKRALSILDELHDMGITLSVDDFGTGYSSLAYLKKLPVSELKIDQSFVFHMADDKDDATIVRSTIEMGHNMGLVVVAEGIENKATWDMLNDMGCDLAQGYYIGKPMPADALLKWLAQAPWKVSGDWRE
ncbi:MAG: EAL domain-containing protein [Nitrosomonadales bacterium]|nr:EAL domain-containing protein [Nitrosomonadales bacterium]